MIHLGARPWSQPCFADRLQWYGLGRWPGTLKGEQTEGKTVELICFKRKSAKVIEDVLTAAAKALTISLGI